MSILVKDKTTGEWVQAAGGVSYSNAPIGSVFAYLSLTPPAGYLNCEGQTLNIADYPELYKVIGTTFGGDGVTTFKNIDLRETVPVGTGTRASGVTAHDTYTLGQFKDDQLQGHSHIPEDYRYDVYKSGGGNYGGGGYGDHLTNAYYSDGINGTPRTGTTTHGKQLGVNYIIKSKDVNLSGGTQTLADRVETLETLASDVIPSGASASNQLATENDIPDISGKQDKITVSNNASTLSDSTIITGVSAVGENPTAIQGHALNKFWTYITGKLTGAVSTIKTSNLTSNRVLISDSSGKVGVSSITTTLLEYLSGLTGNIQTQLTALGGILKHSTSETDTGMTWTNSQKIYRRVITVSSIQNGTLATITANLNIICIRGTVYHSNGYYYNIDAPTGSAASTSFVDIRYEKSTGKVDCNIQGSFAGCPANIIIEYYK